MSEADGVWQLVRGHELLVELVVTGRDFPWLNAKVRPAAGFAEVRPLFDDELRQLEFIDDELEQWEAAYRRIREVVRLLAPDGPGQCLSSCFTSKMRTPGGDGVVGRHDPSEAVAAARIRSVRGGESAVGPPMN